MALDHYISQVYLRNFYSSNNIPPLYAMSKKTLKKFKCKSEDVCRLEEGNTNQYLIEPRAIEVFLEGIEKNYNAAVNDLSMGNISSNTIYTIAGWIAYVATCSPAAMRLFTNPLIHTLKNANKILDRQGIMPKPPRSLNVESLAEAIEKGIVNIEIDSKYVQAIGIKNILDMTYRFGNSRWEILSNSIGLNNPFFTSDYPIALEYNEESPFPNNIIPLTPHLALRIYPNFHKIVDDSFSYNGNRKIEINLPEIRKINTLIVKSAENLIFYNKEQPWIEGFIKRNKDYCIDVVSSSSESSGPIFTRSMKMICKRK